MEKYWHLAYLAAEACMSSSAFSAKFTELFGVSLNSYLTKWRLNLAHH